MVFNIREVVEFDRGGRAFCPSCQLKKGRRPSQRSLAVLPSGAYKCHAGCTPDEIRHAVGQPREQGARICARPVVKLDPPPAKAATVYTQSELKEGTELLLEGKGSPMVAAREWLFQRGFTPEMIRHWGVCFHSRPLGIGIPIPVDESGERFYLISISS